MPVALPPETLKEWLDQGKKVYLLDVRHPAEHQFAALENSVLIPLHDLPSALDEVQPEAGVPVVVYCHHGIRSLSGAAILENAGFPPVYSLEGGLDAWSVKIDPSIPRYR